eukprot:PhF_6_TR34393/c0_g1_i1/m.50267
MVQYVLYSMVLQYHVVDENVVTDGISEESVLCSVCYRYFTILRTRRRSWNILGLPFSVRKARRVFVFVHGLCIRRDRGFDVSIVLRCRWVYCVDCVEGRRR